MHRFATESRTAPPALFAQTHRASPKPVHVAAKMSSTVVPSRRLPLDLQLLSPFLGPPTNAQHTSNGHRPPGRQSSALLDERSIWIPVRRAYSTDTHTGTFAFTSTGPTPTLSPSPAPVPHRHHARSLSMCQPQSPVLVAAGWVRYPCCRSNLCCWRTPTPASAPTPLPTLLTHSALKQRPSTSVYPNRNAQPMDLTQPQSALLQHVPTSVPRASRGRLGEVPLPEQPLLLEDGEMLHSNSTPHYSRPPPSRWREVASPAQSSLLKAHCSKLTAHVATLLSWAGLRLSEHLIGACTPT